MVATAAGYSAGVPGFTDISETTENQVTFQSFFQGDVVYHPMAVLSSTAVDAGNTPTTVLRPGLILAALDSDGTLVAYDPDATNGAQEAVGVLVQEINMVDYTTNSAAARIGNGVVIMGKIRVGSLVNLDMQARRQLAAKGFTFDDGVWTPNATFNRVQPLTTAEIAANAATVTAAMSGRLLITAGGTGTTVYTLPTIAPGLMFEFLNVVDQTMTIASAEGDNMITDNDASADSISFQTASHKIGGRVRVEAIYVSGTLKWIAQSLTTTQTIAT